MTVEVSVIICTYNRAALLRGTLEKLAQQTLDRDAWEAIVVDNASTDGTREVVDEFKSVLPTLCYSREDRPGLCIARNHGLEVSSGERVVYLDDDARPVAGWLQAILKAFKEQSPPPAAVGGPVDLEWSGNRPPWLDSRYWSIYTFLNQGPDGHFLEEAEYLVGANMAFLRDELRSLGGFNTLLDREGNNWRAGADSEMIQKFQRAKLRIYWEPAARVTHVITADRQTRRWLLRRYFWQGAAQPHLDTAASRGDDVTSPRRLAYDSRRAFLKLTHAVWHLATGRTDRALQAACEGMQRSGRVAAELGLLIHARRGDRVPPHSMQ